MTATAEQTGTWRAEFTPRPKAEPWIQALRDGAFERFAELGFPTTHNEEWRFTNVAPIARAAFRAGSADQLVKYPDVVEELDADQVVDQLAHYASFDQNAFVALNTAFLNHQVPVTVFRV